MSFNLNEEVIDGYLVSAETKKLWAVEMDLAKHLLEVCEKHNLKIWAAAGTMLGAVRHNGFIPWDDDMDFCMMRDDYNRLLEVGPKEFVKPYFFQSFNTDEHSWGAITKLRRSDTSMIERDYRIRKDFNRGIFIDILVLDAVPQSDDEYKKMYRKVRVLGRMLQNYRMLNPHNLAMQSKIRHALIYFYVLLRNPDRLHYRIEQLLSKTQIANADLCGAIEFHAMEGTEISKVIVSDKHCYDETIMLPFHDMQIPVPKGYDRLLTDIYGDYMKPVKGGQAHTNLIVDCNRPYEEVLKELKEQQS